MSYDPQYKTLRQEPATEIHRDQHKSAKRKVWRFKSEWLPEKRFVRQYIKKGKWYSESFTLEEALEAGLFYSAMNGPPIPYHKFKTRQDALKSWESMKAKKLIGNRGCKYWLENTDTGEIVHL